MNAADSTTCRCGTPVTVSSMRPDKATGELLCPGCSGTARPDERYDRGLVEDLCAIESGLTEWEVAFVESVAKQVIDRRRPLTDKQRATGERILVRCGPA